MDISLPAVPAGALVVLALVAPYLQAIIQNDRWSPTAKKVLAIVLPAVLAGAALTFHFAYTGDPVPEWPVLVLLVVAVAQASYALFSKSSAKALEQKINPGTTLRKDLR